MRDVAQAQSCASIPAPPVVRHDGAVAVERERLQMQINEIVDVAMELLNVPASYRLVPLPDEKLAFMPGTKGEPASSLDQ